MAYKNMGVIMDVTQMVGRRIQNIRLRKGFTQEQVAERMEISPKYLSSIERGKENPTLKTLIRLCVSLDVELSEIFHQVETEDPAKTRALLLSLVDEANADQLKLVLKMLLAVIR